MNLNEAKELLIEAYDEYFNASYFAKTAKGERKREYQLKMNAVYGRVKNIFTFCPELYDYVENDFFEYLWFEQDLGDLVRKLKEM